MFFREKESDLNVKAAYLHLMSDALVSLGIVVGGILIFYFKWYWLDPLISIAIAIVILLSTWQVLKDSLRLSLDGVPDQIDLNEIKKAVSAINGVVGFMHIHVWAMSTTENALTAQVVFSAGTSHMEEEKLKEELRHVLFHQNIHHITLETIWENDLPLSNDCNAAV
jgi:cobalt-zinc-cadmium efflux system protein